MQYSRELETIAASLVAPGKGILAADESNATMGKRLADVGVDNAEEHRLGFREALFTAPGCAEFISGVILYDETIRQTASGGKSVPELLRDLGMIPGIKVDTGAKDLAGYPGEKVTEGLDGLRERLKEYHALGARFAKWRAVIEIDADPAARPADACIHANAHALARYAALCQENGIVPIVEPEVLMDGDHDIQRCRSVSERTLREVFRELALQGVVLQNMLLKPNMIIAGKKCSRQASIEDVAAETLAVLEECVPAAVPGIVFLSGGQSDELATAHLNAMNARAPQAPWKLSFSYGRALQAPALKAWGGKLENISAAQNAFLLRARLNSAASRGQYRAEMESAA